MKLHRYVDHQRLHIVTKDVISLSISVLLLFRHYISHKITFGAPSSGGVFCSACGAFIPCYRCVTTANILLQVIVDSVAGGDDSDSDGFIKYILHRRIFCFDGG